MTKYNTNLASEFYVLACLHRLGATANLTLGNKKGVDIVVVREAGDAVTVEVKGVADKYEWPADNLVTSSPDSHFVALVCYEGEIDNPTMPPPKVWVFPFLDIEPFKRHYRIRTNVMRSKVLSEGGKYENAWPLILGVRMEDRATGAG